ncbi:MAG: BON domain-containing protein [Anaerolineae bacterium]|nr:BON domain-containing protein [Anaerolineae bacterium]
MHTSEHTFDFAIGTRVYCQDGECGKLTRVVVDQNSLQVKDLIVEKGFLFKRARVFPLSIVASAGSEGIELSIRQNELENFPQYIEEEYQIVTDIEARWPPSQIVLPNEMNAPTMIPQPLIMQGKHQQNTIDHLSILKHGTPVHALDGEIGKLDRIITDVDSGQLTHIAMRDDDLIAEYLPIPVSLVKEVNEDGIHLVTSQEGLKGLNQYHWFEDSPNESPADTPKQAKVLSHDLALRAIVANALSEDPQTEAAVIEVINEQGVITLVGTVDDISIREAAERITATQPGVIFVINSLKVRQDDDSSGGDDSSQTETIFRPPMNPLLL